MLGCGGIYRDYQAAARIDCRVVCAGEHISYPPAWQEGAILSSLAAHAQGAAERAQAVIAIFDATDLERGIAVTEGEAIYKTVCAGCHMLNGEGAEDGAYPALAGNELLEFPE